MTDLHMARMIYIGSEISRHNPTFATAYMLYITKIIMINRMRAMA